MHAVAPAATGHGAAYAVVVTETIRCDVAELTSAIITAARAAGASAQTAQLLARSTVAAELRGKPAVGVAHLFDYLAALRTGRLNGDPSPLVERRRAASIVVDADNGAAQVAFERGFPSLIEAARTCGIAVMSIRRSFTAGELADYSHRIADAGFLALACANSPALMSVFGASAPVTGTNPMSFGLPHPSGPRVFDQASSATAWVSVRDAAECGHEIPDGWAIDADGVPTQDARAALAGALLPFGGVKGANIAVMVEMLAVLSGASFSSDAPAFDHGHEAPGTGLFALAIDPDAFDPGYVERAEQHHRRMAREHGVDFGRRRPVSTEIELPVELFERLTGAGTGAA